MIYNEKTFCYDFELLKMSGQMNEVDEPEPVSFFQTNSIQHPMLFRRCLNQGKAGFESDGFVKNLLWWCMYKLILSWKSSL